MYHVGCFPIRSNLAVMAFYMSLFVAFRRENGGHRKKGTTSENGASPVAVAKVLLSLFVTSPPRSTFFPTPDQTRTINTMSRRFFAKKKFVLARHILEVPTGPMLSVQLRGGVGNKPRTDTEGCVEAKCRRPLRTLFSLAA